LFYWKGLKGNVENFVKQCQVCQQAKSERIHPAGLLQPLPVPAGAWQDITLDFIEKLPKSESYDTILVVVDRFTKYAHFLALKHPFIAAQVAQLLLDHVIKLHGLPQSMVSDRDKIFTSTFWTHLFKLLGTKLNLNTAYHPQTDGQSERVNQCVEMYLRCAVHAQPKNGKLGFCWQSSGTTHPFTLLWGVLLSKLYMDMNLLLLQHQCSLRIQTRMWLSCLLIGVPFLACCKSTWLLPETG
jgi:hypothetical protein